ncbi:MAG TPA: DUF445 domain-containing protein [Verrucomicrobiae bacterium]|nr:DUF445 domain-containing protein [Verrucomicrobiae bacterium]
MDFAGIVDDVQRNWMLYASMPVVAAVIGYTTKLVAIRMMFEPIEFVGRPPYFGWQGIVPRNAERMATIACELMTTRLISPQDVFGKLDPDRVAREIEQPMLAAVDDITREVASRFQPGLWEMLPERMRQLVVNRIRDDAPTIVTRIMQDIQRNIDQVFDLKHMVITNLKRDKALLNRIFKETGAREFRFIAHSGFYFGFAIGCVQAITWALTHNAWVMPLFGGFTGWFTDWLALKMIFEPKQPRRFFGLFEWQGLFIKRRKEVAAEYGALIAKEIITPRNVMEEVLRGPLADRLYEMVLKHVQRSVDEQAGMAKPLVVFAVGGARYQEMKQAVAKQLMARLPDTLRHVEDYAEDAMDLKNTLTRKMQELTEDEFEGLLRPAFKQDEWILIAVGAALGFLVGEMQVFVMLHMGR